MAKPVRASALYGVICVLVGIAGAWFLFNRNAADQVDIPVLKHDVGAYAPIQAADLTTVRVSGRRLSKTAARDQKQLIGRYGWRQLPPGVPLETATLGPALPAGALDGVFLTEAVMGPTSKIDARTEAGMRVDVVFTGRDAPDPIAAVLVLHVARDHSTAVLAIPSERRRDFASGSGQGMLLGTAAAAIPLAPKAAPARPSKRH